MCQQHEDSINKYVDFKYLSLIFILVSHHKFDWLLELVSNADEEYYERKNTAKKKIELTEKLV